MGQEITFNMGIMQIPENRVWKLVCWLPRTFSGTQIVERKIDNLTQHVWALTDIFHIVVADVSGNWDSNKRERVQRMVANFTLVKEGLASIISRGNPFTLEELERLRNYTTRAQQGQIFSSDEAIDYRQLSERASREYAGQDWVGELLKIALFIFFLYALGKVLNQSEER